MADMAQETENKEKRDFRTVTKTGNELVKTITANASSEDHGQIIKEGLESAIIEYIAIIVEKSDLGSLIADDEKYKFLQKVDVKSIFEPKTTEKSVLGEKTQFLVDKIWNDQKVIIKKLGAIDNIEKVRYKYVIITSFKIYNALSFKTSYMLISTLISL